MKEQDLIRKVQEGDSGAFAPLVQRYEQSLKNSVFQILGDVDAAADVTQDAFVSTFEKIHHYNPKYRFFSWIYRIAYNSALNMVIHRRQWEPYLEDDIESSAPPPDAQVETREREAMVNKGLSILVFKYRVLLVLRHFLDFSYSEIATITGLPISTVRSRLHTAKALLKKELKSVLMDELHGKEPIPDIEKEETHGSKLDGIQTDCCCHGATSLVQLLCSRCGKPMKMKK